MGNINIATIIIIATAVLSYLGFKNSTLFYRLSLNPYSVVKRKQWYRLLTHGFIHADMMHLIINMLVLWSFSGFVLGMFSMFGNSNLVFGAFYIGGLLFSSIADMAKNRENIYYNSIGASGAVTATVFASIFFNPWGKIYFFAIVPIPSIIFGVLYIWYEQYSSRRMGDNINHEAHIWGAAWGLLFPIIMQPSMINSFINALIHPQF